MGLLRAGICAVLFASLSVALFPAEAEPAPLDSAEERSLLILSVVLRKSEISDGMAAYAVEGGGTLLPLQGVAELLGIAVTCDLQRGVASGFVLAEDRSFDLDLRSSTVSIAGHRTTVEPLLLMESDDDIYVDSTLLSAWLPIELTIDQSIQRLTIRPREKLPVELRLEREQKLAAGRRTRRERPSYPPVDIPQRLWSRPSLDQGVRFSDDGRTTRNRLTTRVTGDLFFMESEIFLIGSASAPLEDVRWTLRRRASTPSLGGGLRARDIALGYVQDSGSSLINAARSPAPGLLISNYPVTRPQHFDRHTFSGQLLPGWDVELYQNGHLVAYAPSSAEGAYVFADVPLQFGLNAFRLVFYGPQGQVREEFRTFLGSDTLNGAGEFLYRLLASHDESSSSASAGATFGVSRRLTVGAELRNVWSSGAHRPYAKASARAAAGRTLLVGEAVVSNEGTASELGIQVSGEKLSMAIGHIIVSESYVSDLFAVGTEHVRQRSRLRVSGPLPWIRAGAVVLTGEGQRDVLAQRGERIRLHGRASANYFRTAMNAGLLWELGSGAVPDRTEARIQLSRPVGKWTVRGELSTMVRPFHGRDVSATVERAIGVGWAVSASLLESSVTGRVSYALALQKNSGRFAAAFTRFVSGSGGVTHADFFASLSPGPMEGGWSSDARSRAHRSVATLRIFVDRDGDGRYGSGDELLPSVRILVNGGDRNIISDASGIALVTDLVPFQPVNLGIDRSTLDDPLWLPTREGVRVEPRPGTTPIIEFPLRQTAEIDGTIYRSGEKESRGIAATTVELVNARGEVVQRVRSAFDGFYVFSGVFAGDYRVRALGVERAVSVPEEGGAISGIDVMNRMQEP